jgi:hypothetical protein
VGSHEDVERVEVGVQQCRAREQLEVGVIDISRPPLLSTLHRQVGATDPLQPVDDLDNSRQIR